MPKWMYRNERIKMAQKLNGTTMRENLRGPIIPGSKWLTLLLICILYGPVALMLRTSSHHKSVSSVWVLYGGLFLYEVVVIVALYGGLYLNCRHWQSFTVVGQTSSRDLARDFLLGFTVGVFSTILTATLHYLFGSFYSLDTDSFHLGPHNIMEAAIFLPLMVLAATSEELIFRGYFFKQFYAWTGNIGRALVMQAAAFSAAHGLHQTAAGVADRVAFGLLLGWLANREKSLVPGIIAHSVGNIIFALLGMLLDQ
jgi:membrane protease YdiL (CAAX protease family)